MMQRILLIILLFMFSRVSAQEIHSLYHTQKFKTSSDTIVLPHQNINPSFFKLYAKDDTQVNEQTYTIDFTSGKILITDPKRITSDSLLVKYFILPESLTKEYSIFDRNRIVESGSDKLYKSDIRSLNRISPFDGLNTSGSISRGVTVGNNQNAVTNSSLDLQIIGKLSDKVSIRASIQDSNIPIQEGGYSQKLDEFDQIFIELYSDKWNLRAGDLFLENRNTQFLNFNKKVQGLYSEFNFGQEGKQTKVFSSIALVKGQYAKSSLQGQEGNQGPYKLKGNNGELYVLVVSGSERVFVNGILLERGENKQYVIDYNAGEIIFTSLFPITSEMRIEIEYQYSQQNYSRFVSYSGAIHQQEKWHFGGYVYLENDLKNQPLQQNLSQDQVEILKNAGNNQDMMVAPSAYEDSYSENKILYRKILVDGVEVYEYSNNQEEVLYNVKFTFVGQNSGNYILSNANAINKIYQYVNPINGLPQGNYEPVVKLIAPTAHQITTLIGGYESQKTNVSSEVALSNFDQNSYSSIGDNANLGMAAKLNAKQNLYSGNWKLDSYLNYQYINENFKTVERINSIEFNRDWNIDQLISGNQSLLSLGIKAHLSPRTFLEYEFAKLDLSDKYSGINNKVKMSFVQDDWTINSNSSLVSTDGSLSETVFFRSQSKLVRKIQKNWVGANLNIEDNQHKNKISGTLTPLSQRFYEYGVFAGRGDSTKVFAQIGFKRRDNDSLYLDKLQRVNSSDTYYLNSRLIQNENSDLTTYINFRNLKYNVNDAPQENSLNSRILYNTHFFNKIVQWSSTFETTSGTIAQQEYTYVEVEPGQGIYTWIDYNNNGIQELEEFEVAPFPDQAIYVRVFLPNQVYVKTHQNRFSQSINFNLIQWQNSNGIKKYLSKFYNQFTFSVDRKIKREENNFDLNPFSETSDDVLGLNKSIRNSLFYNRGKQDYSVTYTYLSNTIQNLLSSGSIQNSQWMHWVQYSHLIKKSWLLNFSTKFSNSDTKSENYQARNYQIESYQITPKISYLFNDNVSLDFTYEHQKKDNLIFDKESLEQHKLALSFAYASTKGFTTNGEISYLKNDFYGNPYGVVSYQMLEGLQPGDNFVWRLLLQKNLTKFLEVNLNYQGRKSESNQVIHTGNIQLRAFF